MAMLARARAGGRVPIVGIAGAQGSGKTTLAKAFAAVDPGVASFSLDDVYLGRAERAALAHDIHPLFATRGVPGTHDMQLFEDTLAALQVGEVLRVPAFDKVGDEPLHPDSRARWNGRPDLILIEGWCLGATPQDETALVEPVNDLEAREDPEARWRRHANDELKGAYRRAFQRIDALLYLRPPSFEIVHGWRCQQEEGLLGRSLEAGDRDRIARFIQHFERITRHMMAGGVRADVIAQQDEERRVVSVTNALAGSI